MPYWSGMLPTVQLAAPVALPRWPQEHSQRTDATPTLSVAVPRSESEEAEVIMAVVTGAVMVNCGGVVSAWGAGAGVGAGVGVGAGRS